MILYEYQLFRDAVATESDTQETLEGKEFGYLTTGFELRRTCSMECWNDFVSVELETT
jgi:hypothetical protein